MIHPKTLLISRHFYSLESYVWKSIYNLNIDTISLYDIPLDRSFLKLWNGIRHVMPSTDRRLELKEKTSMAQNTWQASVYALSQSKVNVLNKLLCSNLQHFQPTFFAQAWHVCNLSVLGVGLKKRIGKWKWMYGVDAERVNVNVHVNPLAYTGLSGVLSHWCLFF